MIIDHIGVAVRSVEKGAEHIFGCQRFLHGLFRRAPFIV